MTVAQLKTQVSKLKARVTALEEELDYAQAVAGIKRGLKEANAGLGTPARQWAAKVRAKLRQGAK